MTHEEDGHYPTRCDHGVSLGEECDKCDQWLAATQATTEVSSAPAASPALKEKPQTDSHEALVEALQHIAGLSAGWDADGSLGPKSPLSWESVARVSMDVARAALQKAGVTK